MGVLDRGGNIASILPKAIELTIAVFWKVHF